MEKHIQDATPHQHPNNIGMNEGWGNLGVVEELLEKRRKGKVEPCIELLLGEVHGIMPDLLCGYRITLH